MSHEIINNLLSNLSTRGLTFSGKGDVTFMSYALNRAPVAPHISMRHLEPFILKPD